MYVIRVATNGNRSLGFIKRNVKTKSPKVWEMAYQTLVHPQLEYASAIWDPHTKENAHKTEMVQRHEACWATNDYARTTSVTSLLHKLDWPTPEERRSVARLCLFYKVVKFNSLEAVPLPHYIQPTHRISRCCHSMTFCQTHTGKDSYKYSFFPLAISSGMPSQKMLQLLSSLDSFKAAVGELHHPKP